MSIKNRALIKRTGFLHRLFMNRELYLMILPGCLMVLIFSYLPFLGLRLAFVKFDYAAGIWGGRFVGLKYFQSFFSDPYCFRLIRNTFLLSFYTILFTFPAPILFAMLLNEVGGKRFRKFCQSASYLPYFISTVVIVSIMMKMFSGTGIVNMLFRTIGLEPRVFFNDKNWFRPLYVLSELWTNTGYCAIIYLAVLSGVSQELYEAAYIDGANRWQRAIHITLPSIVPTIRVLLILALGSIMRIGFNKVYLMSTPVIYETSDIIATYIYRRGLLGNDFSYATAIGIFNSAISFLIVYLSNQFSRKMSGEALF